MRDYIEESRQLVGKASPLPKNWRASKPGTVRHIRVNPDGSTTVDELDPMANVPRHKPKPIGPQAAKPSRFMQDSVQRKGRPVEPEVLCKLPLLKLWPRDDDGTGKGRPKSLRVIDYTTAAIMHDILLLQSMGEDGLVPEHACRAIFRWHFPDNERRAYNKRIAMRLNNQGHPGFIASNSDDPYSGPITPQTRWYVPRTGLFEVIWHLSRVRAPVDEPLTREQAAELLAANA